MNQTVLRNGTLLPASPQAEAAPVDLAIEGGRISEIAPAGTLANPDFDLAGATVVPGLWDNHIHFATNALIANCVPISAVAAKQAVLDQLRLEISSGTYGATRPLLGFGFRAASWHQPPSAADLAAVSPTVPIALVAGDLHAVWANPAAARLFGLANPAGGYLVETPAFDAISHLVRTQHDLVDGAVASAAASAVSKGLVGIVDFELDWSLPHWLRRISTAEPLLRVEAACYRKDLPQVLELALPETDFVRTGPLKLIYDGSISSKTALCRAAYPDPLPGLPTGARNFEFQELVDLLRQARDNNLPVAVHAIGDLACTEALDAFQLTGARGTIEHAQCVADSDIVRFAQLGVTASMQPAHLAEDLSLLPTVQPAASSLAYRFADLAAAGAKLRFGSDAPVATLDPWLAMHWATNGAYPLAQPLTSWQALDACTRTQIAPGQPADLAVVSLTEDQFRDQDFSGIQTWFTFLAGRLTHDS